MPDYSQPLRCTACLGLGFTTCRCDSLLSLEDQIVERNRRKLRPVSQEPTVDRVSQALIDDDK